MDNITNLFLKIGGLFIFVFTISNINYSISMYMQHDEKSLYSFIAMIIAPYIFSVALSLFMFFKPGKISSKIIDNENNENKQDLILNNMHISKIERLCISILGLYLAYYSFSNLILNILSYAKAVSSANYINSADIIYSNFIITIIVIIVELIISFFLITQNRKIQNFIEKIRNQSRDNTDNCEK